MTNFRRCTGVGNQLQYFIVYLLKASKGERRDAFQAGIIPAPRLNSSSNRIYTSQTMKVTS